MMHHDGYLSTTKWKSFSILLNALLFTCGSLWKNYQFVIVFGKFDYDPHDVKETDLGYIWLTTLLLCGILKLFSLCLWSWKTKIRSLDISQVRKSAILGVIDLIINWCVNYGGVVLLFNAIECSLPSVPSQVIVVFCLGGLTIMSVGLCSGDMVLDNPDSCFSYIFDCFGPNSCLGKLGVSQEELGKSLFNVSVWLIVVMMVNTMSYASGLNNLNWSSIGYLWLYHTLLCIFFLITAWLFWRNVRHNQEAIRSMTNSNRRDVTEKDINEVHKGTSNIGEIWLHLYSKAMLITLAYGIHQVRYATIARWFYSGQLSIYQSFRFEFVSTIVLLMIIISSIKGMLIDIITRSLITRDHDSSFNQDLDVPQKIKNAFNEFKGDFIDFMGFTLITALAFDIGMIINKWSFSLWTLSVENHLSIDQKDERIGVMTAYVVVLHIIAIFIAKVYSEEEMGEKKSNGPRQSGVKIHPYSSYAKYGA